MSRDMSLTDEQRVAERVLRLYGSIARSLDANGKAVEDAESAKFGISAALGGGLGLSGGNADKMLGAMARLDDAVERLCRDADSIYDAYADVNAFIDGICAIDPQAGDALRLRYLEREPDPEVAAGKMGYQTKKSYYDYVRRGLDIAYGLLAGEDGDGSQG